MDLPENEAVFGYLYVEQLPSWRTSKSIWIVDGYSLATHPDLCERVQAINHAAGEPATFRYLYGKPALIAENGVIVAFANGTHTFCVRLPAEDWTRLDPYTVNVPKAEGLARLGAHLERAIAATTSHSTE